MSYSIERAEDRHVLWNPALHVGIVYVTEVFEHASAAAGRMPR